MTEPPAGPSDSGTVVMNLGGDIGALILYTPAELNGREIEISRADDPAAGRTHSQVRPRHTRATPGRHPVCGRLSGPGRGPYTIWRDQQSPAAATVIAGGQVTTSHWPEPGR
jgi:hypothetical protein